MSATIEQLDTQLLINGQFVPAAAGTTFPVENPATGEILARVALADRADVDAGVAAARAALDGGPWTQKIPPAKRGKILGKVADLIRERLDDLARLECLNSGKPIAMVKGELGQAADVFDFFAGAVTKVSGRTLPAPSGFLTYTQREPVGVCALIVPWNYPFMMAAWKVAPALAAGCTVILKPASYTPLTALALGKLCLDAGVPPGVMNVITGPGATTGAYLAAHPGVDKVAFTGETATGKAIMAEAAESVKRVSLELGGKSPNIVFEDADLSAAVNGALFSIFYNAGQSCDARSRIFVQQPVYEAFVAQLTGKAAKLKVGDPFDPATQVGALISKAQLDRVDGYVKQGAAEGAVIACGGRAPAAPTRGYFYLPTVLEKVTNTMTVAQEEIFGPVAAVIPFQDEADAVAQANAVRYGLAATVWTSHIGRGHRVAGKIRSGTVGINSVFTVFPGVPFGGYKQSGFGREMGLEALDLYSEVKSVVLYTGEKPMNPFGA